jgi:hypothetical protein
MNTYTWAITQLACIPSAKGQTNVVSMAHWRINGTDGTNTAEVYGTQPLTFDAKSAFVNYTDLTKDTVVAWVQEAMGADAVTKLQEALDKHLENLANPPVITPPLPWSN